MNVANALSVEIGERYVTEASFFGKTLLAQWAISARAFHDEY